MVNRAKWLESLVMVVLLTLRADCSPFGPAPFLVQQL